MTPERWELVEATFGRALALHPLDRAEFLETATEGDPELRREVEALLREHEEDPSYLEAPPPWLAASSDLQDLPDRIGPYTILRSLGHGGMGQVYLAEREAVDFRQTVALKVMRRGLDTDHLIRRFRNERQILASLDHPNIARLLDVGATDTGRPYFVMEYVEGSTIVAHCDAARLTVRQRLELFATVCSAVQHAHQSLVVHRDLKPGNILVHASGTPKLLDFGIAKILDPARDDVSEPATRVGERLLTPEYAAPEQLRGDVVTTAADVYSLGVLLYHLLTGVHPYGSARRTDAELRRHVLEVDPPPPSAATLDGIAERAAARATTPAQLRRSLRGDIDTIVLKALRKEPEARYPSAAMLAEDVRRALDGLPVRARPATAGYKLGKFVRRNRLGVAAAITLFLLLSGFTGVTTFQSRLLREEAARVTRERDKAQEVRTFLLETFGTTGPGQQAGGGVGLRELLDGRAATLRDAYSSDPDLQAEITGVLAEAYEKLGLYREAEPLARQALEAKRALHGPVHADVVAALNVFGWVQRQLGELEAAETTLDEAVTAGRAVFVRGGDSRLARALNDLGVVREALGDYEQAAAHYRESLDMRRRVLGERHVGVAVTSSNLAVVLYRQGKLGDAVAMAERAVESFRISLGPDHERTMIAVGNMAAMKSVQGDRAGAADTYARIVDRHRRVLGERHPQVAYALLMRANQLVALERYAEAEEAAAEALTIQRATLGARHERLAQTLRVLGDIEAATDRHGEALERWAEALDIVRDKQGPDHTEAGALLIRSARAADGLGRSGVAEEDYRAAHRIYTTALGPDHYHTVDAAVSLAEFLETAGRVDEAAALVRAAASGIDGLGPSFEQLRERADRARERLLGDGGGGT